VATLKLPALSLVVLIGPSGAGKSTFARRHFRPTEVLSSDFFRGLVRDDENSFEATPDAFEALHFVAKKRLAAGLLTVIDATNVKAEDRRPLVALARAHHVLPAAIVLDLDAGLCVERNASRPDRAGSRRFVEQQHRSMRQGVGAGGGKGLEREGFRHVHRLRSPGEIDAAEIAREPLWCDRRGERGPFDCVGDVHGCHDELVALLGRLGYRDEGGAFCHPEGRRALFLGDLVDRGPRSIDCLRLVAAMARAGSALCVPGNHDAKLVRALRGAKVTVAHGLERTLAEFEALPEGEREAAKADAIDFLDGLVSHLVLDGGRLVAAHAGMKREMQGRGSSAVREFALYGETTGEIDAYGLPVRHDWASGYRGDAVVVYGHTPTPEAEWLNKTICLDTGCVFGGKLSALRYPEMELVAVPAARTYCEPARPLGAPLADGPAGPLGAPPAGRSAQHEHDDVLDLGELRGKRTITTRLRHAVTVGEGESAAALEAMSRFAVDPRWLVYLPPTMSPSETSRREGLLEHPDEAFAYYRKAGVASIVCEEKHMGSRAVVVVCRDEAVARRRFGDATGRAGCVYTRTGRPFFADPALELGLLARVREAAVRSGLFDTLATDWLCLDAELMPWTLKARDLVRRQYAAVGAAARASLADELAAYEAAAAAGRPLGDEAERTRARLERAEGFARAYGHYCRPAERLEDLRLAPFHLLASESGAHVDRDHAWHMRTLAALAEADGEVIVATPWRQVTLGDAAAEGEAITWWQELTERGGEGMVVKPLDFIARGPRGVTQPALKCRGREYLRLIYGPEYDLPEHLERLRARGLASKRSLALREFALGVEALERFCRREPLRRVHECVFALLALESEPIDPRL
jgi:protein phosphatase